MENLSQLKTSELLNILQTLNDKISELKVNKINDEIVKNAIVDNRNKKSEYTIKSCKTHGDYKSYQFIDNTTINKLELETTCPFCVHERLLKIDEEIVAKTKIRNDINFIICIRNSKIPPRYEDYTEFNQFERNDKNKKMILSCENYVENWDVHRKTGAGGIIVGGVGTGKTMMGCVIASNIIKKYSNKVLFVTLYDLIAEIRASWSTSKNEDDIYKKFARFDLLIIDEVGVNQGTDNEKEILFRVINDRYNERMPSIIISNLADMDRLKKIIGERVFDRQLESGGFVLNFNWQSYRSAGCLK